MIAAGRFIAVIAKDRSTRKAIGNLLRTQGLRQQGYASAEAFVWRGRADEPACVVLDIELAGTSGVELLNRLKADAPSIPVVVMTGANDAATRRRVVGAGCVACLPKPVADERLLAAVAKALTVNR
jgi:FixJ family two-component response regulator